MLIISVAKFGKKMVNIPYWGHVDHTSFQMHKYYSKFKGALYNSLCVPFCLLFVEPLKI